MSHDNGATFKAFLIAFGIIIIFFLGLAWWSRHGFHNNDNNTGQQGTRLNVSGF